MAFCSVCDSSATKDITTVSVFAFLALISVIFRVWARMIKSVRLELNDYLCIAGLVFALSTTVLAVHSYAFTGFFSVGPVVDTKVLATQFKSTLSGQLLWIFGVTLIRASVIFLYIRIFCTRSFRLVCYGVLILNLAFFTATVLAASLICRPFAYNWDRSLHGTCGNQISLDMFLAVFNLLMDVATVALPLPVLWGLQMPIGRKSALIFLFSMGTAICAITLVRIKATTNITPENGSARYALITLLTCLEQSLGVINACLPVSKPAFDKLKPTSFISFVSSWTSSKRSHLAHGYKKSSTSNPTSLPLEIHTKRELRQSSQDSGVNLPNAIWSPPLSLHRDFEERWRDDV